MSVDEVFDIFREEARDHLSALEQSFLDLETAETAEIRRDFINSAFRHAHSLKSDAKVVGLQELKLAAQTLEDILDELREQPEKVDRKAIDRGLAQFDQVRSAFDNWQSGVASPQTPVSDPQPSAVKAELAAASPPTPERKAPKSPLGPVVPEDERFTVRVPSERLDRMLNLAGEVRISQRGSEAVASRLGSVSEQLSAILAEISKGDRKAIRQQIETTLDHVRRIDGDLRRERRREELLVEDLENNIRQARLLPLAMLTDSLRRTVRDLVQSLDKPITYQADVGTVMLDKAVIEALKDPLTHLIRNAADHGIESAEQRTAAGKPEKGTIRVTASRRGQTVRIAITDDGGGVDFNQVRKFIAESGELAEAEMTQLSERALTKYLFQAGFSTAQAGDISGRGVGLDIVLDTIRRLHGNVELESSSSAGTSFVLTVPVTISTSRILTVLAAGQCYGIPSAAVAGIGRAKRNELRELEGRLVLPVDHQPVRWVHLAELMGEQLSAQVMSSEAWSYLLISSDGRRIAIAVDSLEDESEVLLKPLGYPLTGMAGFVGATIRADGGVQLVLDLADRAFAKVEGAAAPPAVEKPVAGRILVVDDSPTTRAVLRNVFTAAGYYVSTATDGVDALERLAVQTVDVVVCDVEMPRLNGFDLTRQIKSKFDLPVILVTGRESEEHRREGLEAGADAYVIKSTFEDKGLLDIVGQFV